MKRSDEETWKACCPMDNIATLILVRYLNIMDDELIEASQEFYAKHSALYGVKELL